MRPQDIIIVVGGLVVTYLLGTYQGYILGKAKKLTRSEAARIMAKASWANRERAEQVPWRPWR